MYEQTIRVWFDVRPEFEGDITKLLKLRAQLHAELAPELAKLEKPTLPVDFVDAYAVSEANCRDLIDLLKRMRGHKFGQLKAARLEVSLDPATAERAEWFRALFTKYSGTNPPGQLFSPPRRWALA